MELNINIRKFFSQQKEEKILDFFEHDNQAILERISRHCPESLTTYLQIVNRANTSGEIFFSKKMIDIDLSESVSKFKRDLKKLACENLISWLPIDNGYAVKLIGDFDE